jgi:hypothetical protein
MSTDFTQYRAFRVLGPDRVDSGVKAIERLPKIARDLGARRGLLGRREHPANPDEGVGLAR